MTTTPRSSRRRVRLLLLFFAWLLPVGTAAAQSPDAQARIDAACPCYGPVGGGTWGNHGQYMKCVTGAVQNLRDAGTITDREGGQLVRKAAESECGKKGSTAPEEPLPDEQESSPGLLTLQGASEQGFNPLQVQLVFGLQNARFSADPLDYVLEVNGQVVPRSSLVLGASTVSVGLLLQNGRNELTLHALDDQGYLLYGTYTLWAGNRSLPVTLLDQHGVPVNGASVRVVLSDDQTVLAEGTTSGGGVSFANMPLRTLLVTAWTADNRFAAAATVGDGTPLTLRLLSFNAPSLVDNNDFSQGLDGWNVGTTPVQLIPHQEVGGAGFGTQSTDLDLQLSTRGEGPQSISRAFTTKPGTKNVTVRYRFITSEVPAGYFGSVWNDNFGVTLRSQNGGGAETEQNSMNGLGLAAFDGNGATAWREVSLPVSESGDVVQVNISVANVGDGLYDSHVVVDLVDEKQLAITSVALRDIDNTALTFLSLGPHAYFGGNTRVHGTITVEGASSDQLSSLVLEVLRGGAVIATGNLASAAQSTLFQPFGDDEKVALTTSQLLFEIPAGAAPAGDGQVRFRVRARSAAGQQATAEAGGAGVLGRFAGANRYGGRDATVGGDDWAKPSVRDYVAGLTAFTIGDISNMNAGPFPPHGSHRTGEDVDAWFSGYNERNAATAQTLIDFLNGPAGGRITYVFVTYSRTDTDAFWNAIKNVTLNSGQAASAVIRPASGHTTHFHLRVRPGAGAQAQQYFADRSVRGYPGDGAAPAAGRADAAAGGEALRHQATASFGLEQNYPNPFNPSTEIRFSLPEAGPVRLVIYDASGREVMRLVDGTLAAGTHAVTWHAETLPSGLYLYRLEAAGLQATRRMLLVK